MWHALTLEVLPNKFTTIVFTDDMPSRLIAYQLWHAVENVLCGVAPQEPYLSGEFPVTEEDKTLGRSRYSRLYLEHHE